MVGGEGTQLDYENFLSSFMTQKSPNLIIMLFFSQVRSADYCQDVVSRCL